MAKITVVIEDTKDNDFSINFTSNVPLPLNPEEWTEAQKYAAALREAILQSKAE